MRNAGCGTLPGGSPCRRHRSLTLHLNFSPVQLAELSAIDEIERILRRNWPGSRGFGLSFEITEGTMMQNSDTVSSLLTRLRDLHVGLDIDDFGTGYSSLSQLQHLPVQTLKIDRTFVSRIGLDDDSLEIIRTIVALAHNLGMDVIAEGRGDRATTRATEGSRLRVRPRLLLWQGPPTRRPPGP